MLAPNSSNLGIVCFFIGDTWIWVLGDGHHHYKQFEGISLLQMHVQISVWRYTDNYSYRD